jgi:hypothetical protein
MKQAISLGLVVPVLLLVCGSFACGETSDNAPNLGGGATAGASSSSTGGAAGSTSCPAQTPTHGAACQGELSCIYAAFLGCFPSSVLARCQQGRWDVPTPTPYTGPCPGDPVDGPSGCPATLPTAQLSCGMTLDGPVRMFVCEYTDPACVGKRVATCNGQWQITPCEPVVAGGAGGAAGGEGSGGESAGGVSSTGGAE